MLKRYKGDPEKLLTPLSESLWSESEIAIENRGVDGEWLYDLVNETYSFRENAMKSYHSQEKASLYNNDIPWPKYPDAMDAQLTAHNFVSAHVVPLTQQIHAPLYARTPKEKRGQPTSFLSYTWNSQFFAGGYGIFYCIHELLKAGTFFCIDIVCHNQHNVGSVAHQMEKVISGVERVILPMSNFSWYDRTWCIWELICAKRFNKEIKFIEYQRKERDYKHIRSSFLSGFSSILHSQTSVPEDKEQILEDAIKIFGSIKEADKFIVGLIKENLDLS